MRRHAKAATAGSTKRLGKSKPALLLCVLAASVAALALVVGSASGATTRFLVEAFGSSVQPSLPADRGMAFDQGASQLYVIDSTNDTVSRFNADGTPADFGALGSNVIDGEGTGDETPLGHLAFEANRQREQLAIDESGGATDGNIYATRSASDVVDVFASTGEYKGTLSESTATGAFGEPCGVAVDSAGNVYVGDRGDDRIHVYEPAGAVPANADNSASFATVTDPCTLAAGSGATAGFLFVNASTGAQLRKVDAATGEVKYEIASGGSTVSVDPATGHVFVARNTGSNSSVDEYDASGAATATLVSSFKPGQTVEGIALNSAAEQVYVARSGTENVEVFGPAAIVPDVITSPPSSNTGVRATLAGTVNPDGVELDECLFEWGQGSGSIAYTDTAPCAQTSAEIGAGTAPVAVHADLGGLTPQGTNYHYRLVAENPNATINGSNQNFTTPNTVVTQAATGLTDTEATLNGTVNPDTATISGCVFEWGPEKAPFEESQLFPETAPCVPGPGGIGTGTAPIAVEAELSGLHPGSRYVYRLKATYPTGPATGAALTAQSTGPRIAASWSEDVLFTEATLKTQVDPEGQATTYRFEWGTSTAYGSQTEEAAVGSDSSVHELTAFLEGLQPDTTYHWRVVATSAGGENQGPDHVLRTFQTFAPRADCANQAFRYGAGANLPDCRAYEMVSPVDKGGDIEPVDAESSNRAQFMQSSLDGEKLTYSSFRAFGDALSAPYVSQYLATRGPDGWSSHSLNAPQGLTVFDPVPSGLEQRAYFEAFTPDLSSSWLFNFNKTPLTPDGLTGYVNVYRRDNLTDRYEALTNQGPFPPLPGPAFGPAAFIPGGASDFLGASEDLSHQVLAASAALTPDAGAHTDVQVYDLHEGELHLVSVLPNGEAYPGSAQPGGAAQDDVIGAGSARQGNVNNVISDDGSRIFWVGGSNSSGPNYVRENPAEEQSALNGSGECTEPAKACTRLLDVGEFWSATPDGSRVLFVDAIGTSSASDLWIRDVDTEAKADIAGEVTAVLGVADDLSRVYFASKEDLASGAAAGSYNLYAYHEGAIDFIATLSAADRAELYEWDLIIQEKNRHARATPDGRHFVFMSNAPLTGYDNADAASGQADQEVFVYDAEAAQLSCASCNPSGARPAGGRMAQQPFMLHAHDGKGPWAAAWIPAREYRLNESRPLSANGNRLFFNSFDALVPRDTNAKQDVYQWEAPGSGDCTEGSHEFSELNDGCVSLISSGESSQYSEFIDASLDGSNVFFETRSSLTAQDPGLVDIYSARVEGGYPYVPTGEPCVGDACQSIPAAPSDPTPASASFRGAGDPEARRNCRGAAKRAVKLARQVKRLRRAAKRTGAARRSAQLRRRSALAAKQAKRLSRGAKRCRRANRRATR